MDIEIEKAEQQLIGFIHAKSGYDLISLIKDMGLTIEEWEKIKSNGMHIPNEMRAEIDHFLYIPKNSEKRVCENCGEPVKSGHQFCKECEEDDYD